MSEQLKKLLIYEVAKVRQELLTQDNRPVYACAYKLHIKKLTNLMLLDLQTERKWIANV
jgi:hypothetical protein